MRTLLLLAFAAATPAWAQQKALPVDGMSEAQRADHRKLMRGYLDTFRGAQGRGHQLQGERGEPNRQPRDRSRAARADAVRRRRADG